MKRGGRWYYEAQAAAAFRRTHRDDPDQYVNRGRGQRLRAKQPAAPADQPTASAPAVPTTPEELERLAREGRITQAGLAIAEKTIALRTRMREELEAAGGLLKREDVAQAAAESLAEIRGVLLNLPARAASAAAAMFTLTPMRQAALRELLEREVDAAMLAAGGMDERSTTPPTPPVTNA